MQQQQNSAPGFKRHPDHNIEIKQSSGRWLARVDGIALADSKEALILRESNLAPVTYFPRHDVRAELFEATSSKTFCPFKGEASYLSLVGDDNGVDIAWSYPNVFSEVAEIEGYVAFYSSRVEITESI
jgi:uncharacterized protein (DUF427 family)